MPSGRYRPRSPVRYSRAPAGGRVRDEFLLRQVGAIPVPAREAVAADAQLTGGAAGQDRPLRVQDQDFGAPQRPADGNRRRLLGNLADRMAGREGGALRRPVPIDEAASGKFLQEAADPRDREHVPARQELPQRAQVFQAFIHHEVKETRRQPERRDAVSAQGRSQVFQRSRSGRKDHQAPAVAERGPDLERRGVEGEGASWRNTSSAPREA